MTSDVDRTALTNHAEYTPITVRSGTAPAPKPVGEVEGLVERLRAHDLDMSSDWKVEQDQSDWCDTADSLLAEAATALTRERELRVKAEAGWDASADALAKQDVVISDLRRELVAKHEATS